MRIQRAWTQEDINILNKMRLDNEKIAYIAITLDRTFASIASKLSYMHKVHKYKKWTDNELNLAKRMIAEGYSYGQIAIRLKRTTASVKGKFHYMRGEVVMNRIPFHQRVKYTLTREEVEKTGLPFYVKFDLVPDGLYTKTKCMRMLKPIKEDETPVAYVLARQAKGYVPLYKRY